MASRDWSAIVIHHSDTVDDGQKDDWAGIVQFHTSWRYKDEIVSPEEGRRLLAAGEKVVKPWRAVGYHWGIESVAGKVCFQKGRGLDQIGAHCVGMNSKAIGICCVGDFDRGHPSDSVYYNCAQLCVSMMKMFPRIALDAIYPHREFADYKTCPGNMFDMGRLLRYVRMGYSEARP